MDHAIDTCQRASDRIPVAYVGMDQFDITGKFRRLRIVSVHLGNERVEEANAVPALQQFASNEPADEACSAGNENGLAQSCLHSRS